ncbi:MAG TPA: ABC transporter permease subunit [Tepidisphaeraceae bacterium]|nr:ABC transporter permease subunit [Tepidisphaeraceae bacterium]
MRLLKTILPPLVPLLLVTALAEVAVRMGWVPAFLVPPPSRVLAALAHPRSDIWPAAWATAWQAGAGFAASVVVGMSVGVALASADWVQRAFYPYAVFFQTVPIIAIAPLLVIWVGWGRTVVASAFIVSIFPVIASTLAGLLSTDPALRELFHLYGAGPVARLVKLRLPAAMPSLFTGLQVAAGLAVVGAIVGEFVTGGGLGGLIQVSKQQQRVDKIFAGLIAAAALGVLLFASINVVRFWALRHWHASERA